jgi:hypothetical protein
VVIVVLSVQANMLVEIAGIAERSEAVTTLERFET